MKKLVKKFFRQPWLQNLIPRLAWIYLRIITKGLKYQIQGEENMKKFTDQGQPVILACWHGGLVVPMYYLRNKGIYVLSSTHRDSEYLAWILQRFGWRLVKGSTGRGGAKAFIEMMHKVQEGNLVSMTPDGPTGPAKQLKPGLLQLAAKTGAPIVPLGVSAYPCKKLKTWDSFLLPAKGAKAAIIFGQPFWIEKKLSSEEMAEKSGEVEKLLTNLEEEAEKLVLRS